MIESNLVNTVISVIVFIVYVQGFIAVKGKLCQCNLNIAILNSKSTLKEYGKNTNKTIKAPS